MNIYERMGVATIVNAKGPATRLSGALMAPEVSAAMSEAAEHCVDIAQLQAHASDVIARHTGAEAGYVTSGAAAGLLLATAACVAKLDPAAMGRLPDTRRLASEVVVIRSQRNAYDHTVRSVGVRLVEVGLPDRYAGAGVRDAEPWEIADAISERTAAVFYVADHGSRPSLDEVVAVAHDRGVPVIVDAAAQLPPAANLTRFIATGADLVAFSGGKTIGGPQATGILCGRRDLIMSAALQHLDTDIAYEQWNPPPTLIDKSLLRGVPHNGIGRPCKVGREDVVGLLTALDLFVAEGDEIRHRRWLARLTAIMQGLDGINGARTHITGEADPETVPLIEIQLADNAPMSALDLAVALQNGAPSVHVDPTWSDRGRLHINPTCLRDDQIAVVAPAIRAALGG